MAGTQVCSQCGYTNAAGASFCGRCGQSLIAASTAAAETAPQFTHCPFCERPNPVGATYCGHCGQPLPAVAAEEVEMSPWPVVPPSPVPAMTPPKAAGRSQGRLLALMLLAGALFALAIAALILLPRLTADRALGAEATAEAALAMRESDDATEQAERAENDLTATAEAAVINEPDDSAQITVAALPSATFTLAPTVTPFPTGTPRPTLTPMPTRTPLPPTPIPPPTAVMQPTAPPPPPPPPTSTRAACLLSPGPRWGPTMWDRYQDRLGCATTDEMRTNAAYQYYENGMMVWREVPDLVYVLYNNGSFNVFPAEGPDGYFVSDWVKGSFGYLWTNNATVRSRIGQAEAAEFNATNFAAQDFAGGTIFYFLENNAHNYALFNDNGTWTSAQQ